jgi:quinol monooxygenase YgiN
MLHVLAIITTKPGKRDEVLAIFHKNIPAVHAEAGCIEYGPVVDAVGFGQVAFGPDTFVVVEKWESQEALSAHARSAHMAAYAAAVGEMIADRAVHIMRPA